MKRLVWLSILLTLLLAACNRSGAGAKCEGGVCITIEIVGPVQATKSAQFVISVRTEKDVSGLGISLFNDPGVTLIDLQKSPEGARLLYQDKRSADWNIDTKGGEEYKLSGYIIVPKPAASYGVFSSGPIARAYKPGICDISTFAAIYLDAEGNQVDESKANKLMQTGFPRPILLPPNFTVVPETALPRVTSTTMPPTIMPTSTLAAYPALDGTPGSESVNKIQPTQMQTLQAYPSP